MLSSKPDPGFQIWNADCRNPTDKAPYMYWSGNTLRRKRSFNMTGQTPDIQIQKPNKTDACRQTGAPGAAAGFQIWNCEFWIHCPASAGTMTLDPELRIQPDATHYPWRGFLNSRFWIPNPNLPIPGVVFWIHKFEFQSEPPRSDLSDHISRLASIRYAGNDIFLCTGTIFPDCILWIPCSASLHSLVMSSRTTRCFCKLAMCASRPENAVKSAWIEDGYFWAFLSTPGSVHYYCRCHVAM